MPEAKALLEAKALRKRLGPHWALDGCDLHAAPGERIVIRGVNGAGKSTLLQVLAGVLRPDQGELFWDKKPMHGRNGKRPVSLGYVPEAADPPGHLSVAELLHFVAAVKGCATPTAEFLAPLQVDALLGERIDELSLGQRRRACLAAAFTGDPELLLLDEPTNGLDADSIDALAAMLALPQDHRILICATHDMRFAEAMETRRLTMADGRMLDGESE